MSDPARRFLLALAAAGLFIPLRYVIFLFARPASHTAERITRRLVRSQNWTQKVCKENTLMKMKKQYKLLLWAILIEFIIGLVLGGMGFSIQSWIGNALGVFIFLLPVQILLFKVGRDTDFSKRARFWFKALFWYLNFCYVGGGIATFLYGN